MGRKNSVLALALGLVGCGGGGGTPTTPNTPAPSPHNYMTLTVRPDTTTTINVEGCNPGHCTSSAITFTVGVIYNRPTKGAQVYLQLFKADGKQCANGLSPSFDVDASPQSVVYIRELTIQCQGMFTTDHNRLTLFPANPAGLSPSERADGLLAQDVFGGFRFVTSR